jgi:hypothetical protein
MRAIKLTSGRLQNDAHRSRHLLYMKVFTKKLVNSVITADSCGRRRHRGRGRRHPCRRGRSRRAAHSPAGWREGRSSRRRRPRPVRGVCQVFGHGIPFPGGRLRLVQTATSRYTQRPTRFAPETQDRQGFFPPSISATTSDSHRAIGDTLAHGGGTRLLGARKWPGYFVPEAQPPHAGRQIVAKKFRTLVDIARTPSTGFRCFTAGTPAAR